MNNEETKIPLFRRCVLQNFPFIEQDFDALTDYALLCKVVEYLNTVITATNENSAQVEALSTAFNNLKSYVDNYFENLDVQEEINNKLDEMAEDGSLIALIEAYVQPIQEAFETQVNTTLGVMQTQINSVASGSPAGVYATVSALTTADPDHSKIYLVTADGKWYFYDGNSWTAGGTYQSTGISDNSITYPMLHQDILVDYSDILESNQSDSIVLPLTSSDFSNISINASTGVESASDNNISSRYIAYNKDYYVSVTGNGEITLSNLIFHYYDKNMDYIGARTFSINALNTPFRFRAYYDENAYFIRVRLNATGIEPSDISNFTIKFTHRDGVNAKWTSGINLVNTDVAENVFISNQNGTLSDASTSYMTTEYMLVEPSTTYTFKNRIRFLLEFDSSMTAISGTYVNQAQEAGYSFTTTANTKWVQMSYYKEDTDIMMYKGTDNVEYVPYKKPLVDYAGLSKTMKDEVESMKLNTTNILSDKKLVACGDSFTQYTNEQFDSGIYKNKNKVWPYLIGLRNNMNVKNMAVSGSSMAITDDSATHFSDTLYTSIPDDADYIIIKYGINDSHKEVPIGNISSTDRTTFYGAWNVVMSYIIEHYPTAKIGIIVTNGLDLDTSDENNSAYAGAIKAIALKYGIPTLNEWNDPNVPLLNRTGRTDVDETIRTIRNETFRISSADTHENALCQQYESTIIENFIRSL